MTHTLFGSMAEFAALYSEWRTCAYKISCKQETKARGQKIKRCSAGNCCSSKQYLAACLKVYLMTLPSISYTLSYMTRSMI
uniref:Uncharacterized protein n=1 Tax=Dicentrarchus labrax TaxID=13489 RepID=A0A8C4DET2_DICLA